MRQLVRTLLCAALIAGGHLVPLAAGPAVAQVQTAVEIADITGVYDIFGRNADGSSYRGVLSIEQASGQAVLNWTVGAQSYQGRGAFAGNVLVVDWGAKLPVIYVVGSDGTLMGTWDGGLALERAVRR
ncbi:MAG: hypothetical protein JJ864_17750 [Rhizobiaceae bacterium]|nr:hypothetical protein [Rhizobiaceae bacterium]